MLSKTHSSKIKKVFGEINIDDSSLEYLATFLEEVAEQHEEKGREEKAEAYSEVAESIVNFVEAFQELYSVLEEHDIIE